MIHVPAVPEGLEDAVAEAEGEDVLDRLLPQVVVDPIDLRLVEGLVDLRVQRDRRGQVVAERLLDDHAAPARPVGAGQLRPRRADESGRPELSDHGRVAGRRRGQIVHAVSARPVPSLDLGELFAKRRVSRRVLEGGRHIIDPARQPLPDLRPHGAEARELVDRHAYLLPEGLVALLLPREADHREPFRQEVVVRQGVQRGKQLAPRQVPRGAEDHQAEGLGYLIRGGGNADLGDHGRRRHASSSSF